MMKNYQKYNIGDKVIITHSHSDDEGKEGIIIEVRHSFCKIKVEGYSKPRNHTYGQFMHYDNWLMWNDPENRLINY